MDSSHPLMRRLKAIRHAGGLVQEIILAPLTCADMGRFLADSLHGEPDRITTLVQLVHEKTAGNPFFAVQFISALVEEALLRQERVMVTEVRGRYEPLTNRERQVMRLVVSGLLNKQIAGELGSSEVTVKMHRGQVMRKMKARSIVELLRMAEKIRITGETAPPTNQS